MQFLVFRDWHASRLISRVLAIRNSTHVPVWGVEIQCYYAGRNLTLILAQESKQISRSLQRLGNTVFYAAPVLVIGLLWLCVFLAYYTPGVTVTDAMEKQARESPSDAVLEELRDFHFLILNWQNQQDLIDAASGMLEGKMRTATCSTRISIAFSAQDLKRISPDCDLLFAAFVVPDVLLQAYDATGRKEFFTAAQAFITSAQAIDQSAWLPPGELWNDHAVAARICVLANFWRLYRHSPDYRPEVGRKVLQMVAHSEELLAKPGQFTFATNHGIMQNLGLWHATLAFPSLPHAEEYRQLAQARLTEQFRFLISQEGVVLEHSAGYHQFGLELFGMALRYLDLLDEPVPPDWIEKYERAKTVYAALRRPDGTLPMVGDTDDEALPLGPLVTSFDAAGNPQRLAYPPQWKPAEAVSLYPVSGYAIWWDGLEFWPKSPNLAQTVVAWSYFFGHGHKHADEMSVLFWAGGQNWLSNIGYWPYGDERRREIQSWPGSNAPHLSGEDWLSIRTTRLVSSASSEKMTALELERTGHENYVARRQVIHCKPNLWLVLDNTSGRENTYTSTTWTAVPQVHWQPGPTEGAFRLENPHTSDYLEIFFLGPQNAKRNLFRGSSRPFAGWQLEEHRPALATALVMEQPVQNSWAATIWTLEKRGAEASPAPQMTRWTDATSWEVQWPESGGVAIRREGNTLRFHPGHGAEETLELTAPLDPGPAHAELDRQFMATASRYHLFSANLRRRKKVTYVLLSIFLLQLIFFKVYKRVRLLFLVPLKYLSVVAWIAGGIWLVISYV